MIEIDSLTKRYGETAVVDSVTMTVRARTLTVIVGTSGSGKTTLLRMVNRLVEPSSGSVRIDGEPNDALPPYELRRRIGYVIQGYGLFPHRTVAQNIATVPQLTGWKKEEIAARVDELLTLFQLEPGAYRDRYPHELSGGQQQRVGVARALAAKPNVLLMDEPFGALDPVIRAKAQADLVAIQKKFGTTIILVTHDMQEAMELGDHIAVMHDGALVQYATPAEVLASPATDFVDTLVGTGDRPFRYLSLSPLDGLVEEGAADGAPLTVSTTCRDALARMLWERHDALPVVDAEGRRLGRVTRRALIDHAARPAL